MGFVIVTIVIDHAAFTGRRDMFVDRTDAGRKLAGLMSHLVQPQPLVLGLPRGGVVVAAEIAQALAAPLDVLVVRKLGAPYQPELAIGAVIDGEPPRTALNEDLIRMLGVGDDYIEAETFRQLAEARRRQEAYRRGRPAVGIAGRVVVIVDDGIATGATVRAAISGLAKMDAKRLVLAVPVGAPHAIGLLEYEVDELICISVPPSFRAVGSFYRQFSQTTDEQVIALLAESRQSH